jgi:hypothetical protein
MIVLFITPHTNHEVISMAYSWEDKCTFIELKLMATNILCKVMNDEVYSRELLNRKSEKAHSKIGCRGAKVIGLKGNKVNIREKKADKQKPICITPFLERELNRYIEGKRDDEYLMKNRNGHDKPISRSMAYKILRKVAERFHLDEIVEHISSAKHSVITLPAD